MILELSPLELDWLSGFFAPPNELTWAMLQSDAAPEIANQIKPWLEELVQEPQGAAVVLPLVRSGAPIGWYAATANRRASEAFAAELAAWLGPSYLTKFEWASAETRDARVRALRKRFAGAPLLLSGGSPADNKKIAERLLELAKLRSLRPPSRQNVRRPVGRIRADFDRALLTQDEHRATELLNELRNTGRLNEENLRYLDVRLQAGLGYWPQIARNHWLIATLSDLRPPPQILADLVEALYRTFVEPAEVTGDASKLLAAFETAVAKPYPRLFASRRGVRAPRVVKAFLLYERLRPQPTAAIVGELRDLLPVTDRESSIFQSLCAEVNRPSSPEGVAEADAAFDDGEFDRAFELYMACRTDRKTLNRLLLCGDHLGEESRRRLAARLEEMDAKLVGELSLPQQHRLADLRAEKTQTGITSSPDAENPWIAWALQLQQNRDLAAAERAVRQGPVTWDITSLRTSEELSARLADLIGKLDGEAAAVARRTVAALMAAFFPPGEAAAPALRPLAAMLFLLIAMDDPLSQADLELMAQLLNHRLALGLAAAEYVEMVRDLQDVQARVASYATLPWSLDVCEALAIAPAGATAAQEARLGFFMSVLSEAQGLSHRLQQPDLMTLDLLAKDFQTADGVVAWLRQLHADIDTSEIPNLAGKRIGIYTLAEAAGGRAKAGLESMYPGCRIELNSDLVCTPQLASLAKAADLFVFAWKSSSHQAFYCVKDAMAPREPIWAAGKGTASILRAVADSLS